MPFPNINNKSSTNTTKTPVQEEKKENSTSRKNNSSSSTSSPNDSPSNVKHLKFENWEEYINLQCKAVNKVLDKTQKNGLYRSQTIENLFVEFGIDNVKTDYYLLALEFMKIEDKASALLYISCLYYSACLGNNNALATLSMHLCSLYKKPKKLDWLRTNDLLAVSLVFLSQANDSPAAYHLRFVFLRNHMVDKQSRFSLKDGYYFLVKAIYWKYSLALKEYAELGKEEKLLMVHLAFKQNYKKAARILLRDKSFTVEEVNEISSKYDKPKTLVMPSGYSSYVLPIVSNSTSHSSSKYMFSVLSTELPSIYTGNQSSYEGVKESVKSKIHTESLPLVNKSPQDLSKSKETTTTHKKDKIAATNHMFTCLEMIPEEVVEESTVNTIK